MKKDEPGHLGSTGAENHRGLLGGGAQLESKNQGRAGGGQVMFADKDHEQSIEGTLCQGLWEEADS